MVEQEQAAGGLSSTEVARERIALEQRPALGMDAENNCVQARITTDGKSLGCHRMRLMELPSTSNHWTPRLVDFPARGGTPARLV